MEAQSKEQTAPQAESIVCRQRRKRGVAVQLTFDADLEAFRAECVAFLDSHLPELYGSADVLDRPRSSSDVPEWARPPSSAAATHRC